MALAFDSFAPSAFRRFGEFGTRRQPAALPPEQERSLLMDMGGSALKGIGAVGALLDVPGGMVRNALAGEDPTVPIFNPLSMQDRVWGRDLLTQWSGGIVPENYEGFSVTDVNSLKDLPWDVLGFAAEVILDPLTYLTFGASALTKVGKAARGVGAIDDLARLTKAGPRVNRMTGKLSMLTESADPRFTKWADELPELAKKLGIGKNELLDAQLGTLGRFGIGDFSIGFGRGGPISSAVGGGMDYLGKKIRYSAPVRYAAAHLSKDMRGLTTAAGQADLATELAKGGDEFVAAARRSIEPEVKEMVKHQWFDPHGMIASRNLQLDAKQMSKQSHEFGAQFNRYIETGADFNPAELSAYTAADFARAKEIADTFGPKLTEMRQLEASLGGNVDEVDDVVNEILKGYFPRVPQRLPGDKVTQRMGEYVIATAKRHVKERSAGLSGFSGGTYPLQKLSMDAEVSGIAAGGKLSKEAKAKAIEHVRKTYGDMMTGAGVKGSDFEHGLFGKGSVQYGAIVEWAAHLPPGHAANSVPAFVTNPIAAMVARMEAGAEVSSALEGLHGFLKDNLVEAGGIPIRDVFRSMDKSVDHTRAMWAFAKKQTGMTDDELRAATELTTDPALKLEVNAVNNPEVWKEATKKIDEMAENWLVPKEIAADATRFIKSYTTPDSAMPILKLYDDFTRMWKGAVTVLWPSFHSRNLISGQLRNMQAGAWSWNTYQDAKVILSGRTIVDAAERYKMLRPKDATVWNDKVATDLIRQDLFSYKVLTHHQGIGQEFMGSLGRHSEVIGPTQPEKLGFGPFGGAYAPRPNEAATKWQRWNPIGDEGGLQRYGAGMAYYVEGLNRIAPFLKKRAEGWSSRESSRLVDMLQVNYERLTTTEKTILRRIFPFYTFNKGVIPWTVRTLLEKPGGVLAQTAKLPARASAGVPVSPEYISKTAAIPMDVNERGAGKYLATLGLMEEPGYALMSPLFRMGSAPMESASELGREVTGNFGPLPKALSELTFGRSAFFGGAETGGRELTTMTGPVGQIMSNVTGAPSSPFGMGRGSQWGPAAEYLVGMSPASRAASELAKLTKPSDQSDAIEKGINFLTGLKIRNVSEAQASTLARETIGNYIESLGGGKFTRSYIREEDQAFLTTTDRQGYEKAMAYNAILQRRGENARKMRLYAR